MKQQKQESYSSQTYYQAQWRIIEDMLNYVGQKKMIQKLDKYYGKSIISKIGLGKDMIVKIVIETQAENRLLKKKLKEYRQTIDELSQIEMFDEYAGKPVNKIKELI